MTKADERFDRKVLPGPDGCLIWHGARSASGAYGRSTYGNFWLSRGRFVRAHRYAWERVHGPIPRGFHVHHKCRNRLCVNVEHLEPMRAPQNIGLGNKERRRAA